MRFSFTLFVLSFVLSIAVPPSLSAQYNIDILHAFSLAPDGGDPNPNLIQDSKGNLFGTTNNGGDRDCVGTEGSGCGIVFEYAADGMYSILYSFQGENDGASPMAGVAVDSAGNLFGTTRGGNGAPSTIYEIPSTGGEVTLKVFSNFADGASAQSAPILGPAGSLLGSTMYGGDFGCGFNGGCGVVYAVEKNGDYRVLHTFTALSTGIQPVGSPVLAQGNLYGLTQWGGDMQCEKTVGCGTVYELTKEGKYKVLYKFTGETDGASPDCISDGGNGNLVGVTSGAGDPSCPYPGCGTIFQVNEATGNLKTLFDFPQVGANSYGHSCLVHDASGNLYGTTSLGGTHGGGFLYEFSSDGVFTVLYNFEGSNSQDGSEPASEILDPNGTFYGLTYLGGNLQACGFEGCGTIFSLTPVMATR